MRFCIWILLDGVDGDKRFIFQFRSRHQRKMKAFMAQNMGQIMHASMRPLSEKLERGLHTEQVSCHYDLWFGIPTHF